MNHFVDLGKKSPRAFEVFENRQYRKARHIWKAEASIEDLKDVCGLFLA